MKRMYPVLHNILLELDSKMIDTHDYFKWSEEEKIRLTEFIGRCFKPILREGDRHKHFLMASLWRVIKECEMEEEYEQADILSRALANLESGYWK